MGIYAKFSAFYDELMGDRSETIDQLRSYLAKHLPTATSLLELGCGTGALLAGFAGDLTLAGVDQSPEMLAIAAERVPGATLTRADMSKISLGARYDVVICMFDTLNHLPRFDDWVEVFKRAHEHLVEGGLFIFDVNTIGRLRGLGRQQPYVEDFAGNSLIMNVTPTDSDVFVWEVKIFEHLGEDIFKLHHETILELGVPLTRIRAALEPYFDVLDEDDQDGRLVSDDADRIFFACRSRG
jgi:SAM-dependent methyltransferase